MKPTSIAGLFLAMHIAYAELPLKLVLQQRHETSDSRISRSTAAQLLHMNITRYHVARPTSSSQARPKVYSTPPSKAPGATPACSGPNWDQ